MNSDASKSDGAVSSAGKPFHDALLQLREVERTLDQIFSEAPSFMALLSVPDFRYLRTNAKHLELIGKNNIIGKTVFEVEPEMERQGVIDLLREVVRSGKPYVGRELPIQYDSVDGRLAKVSYLDFIYQPLRRADGEIYAISAQGHDVTEMVHARKAIENERENFRNLFRQTPEMVCILRGPEHVFEFVNEAHVKALGFNATGKTVREAQPESVEVHGILDNVFRTGNTANLHEIPITLTDRVRYFNVTYAARHGDDGKINGIMVLGVEVTDQVKTRELQESQNFLSSLVENLPNMLFVKDAKDLRFVRFNKAGEELLGVPRAELFGRSDYDFFPKHEADHFVSKDREVLAGREVLDIPEETIQTRNGPRILHTRKIPILGSSGEPEYLLGISEDITERKRAENDRLSLIREQVAINERKRENDRSAFLAEASTILASSLDYRAALAQLTKLTVPAMAEWCTVSIVGAEGKPERVAAAHSDPAKAHLLEELALSFPAFGSFAQAVERAVQKHRSSLMPQVSETMLREASRNDRHFWIMRELGLNSYIVAPILSRNGALGAITLVGYAQRFNESDLALVEEIGRRAGIAIDNARLYESARQAVQTRDEFMSLASHELKTPLTSLQLQTELRGIDVNRGNFHRFSPENLPKLLSEDRKQINRLIRLVEDMLDISRINMGKLALAPEEFDLCEMARDTVSRFSSQFEAAGVKVSLKAEESVLGSWDRFRLEQVLTNLLTNALKYGDRRPVYVSVENEGAFARLDVRDEGIGISRLDQQRIFGQFERAVSGSSISGLGLGLFISKKIVEAHKGEITVESEPGLGSRFSMLLPRSILDT